MPPVRTPARTGSTPGSGKISTRLDQCLHRDVGDEEMALVGGAPSSSSPIESRVTLCAPPAPITAPGWTVSTPPSPCTSSARTPFASGSNFVAVTPARPRRRATRDRPRGSARSRTAGGCTGIHSAITASRSRNLCSVTSKSFWLAICCPSVFACLAHFPPILSIPGKHRETESAIKESEYSVAAADRGIPPPNCRLVPLLRVNIAPLLDDATFLLPKRQHLGTISGKLRRKLGTFCRKIGFSSLIQAVSRQFRIFENLVDILARRRSFGA